MAKTLYGHRIGANVHEKDAAQGVKIVPDNKTLMAMKFNEESDDEVMPTRVKNMKELFQHYKPSTEVEVKDAEDEAEDMTFKFSSLKDFTKEGIIEQSGVLRALEDQAEVYSRLVDVLKNNDRLKTVINNDEHKKEFVELLETLIVELTETE